MKGDLTLLSPHRDLKNELACPVQWDDICSDGDFATWLRFMWSMSLRKYEVNRETRYLSEFSDYNPESEMIEDSDESFIREELINVRQYSDRAKADYRAISSRFVNLKAASAKNYPKHYPRGSESNVDIEERSKSSNISILKSWFSDSLQSEFLWHVMKDAFERESRFPSLDGTIDFDYAESAASEFTRIFCGNPKLLIANNCVACSGWTSTGNTVFVMVDIDFSTPIAHVYPISEIEYYESSIQTFVSFDSLCFPYNK